MWCGKNHRRCRCDVKGKNPLKDVRVRKALYQAIDANTIGRVTMRGLGQTTGALVAPQVAGWTEGVQLMNKGSKFKFYIPSDLAYGANGQGEIGPNEVLIFEVELIDFKSM